MKSQKRWLGSNLVDEAKEGATEERHLGQTRPGAGTRVGATSTQTLAGPQQLTCTLPPRSRVGPCGWALRPQMRRHPDARDHPWSPFNCRASTWALGSPARVWGWGRRQGQGVLWGGQRNGGRRGGRRGGTLITGGIKQLPWATRTLCALSLPQTRQPASAFQWGRCRGTAPGFLRTTRRLLQQAGGQEKLHIHPGVGQRLEPGGSPSKA